jgi:hypothetical protein
MLRNKLLVLQKTLTNLPNKGFIYVNNFLAAAFVLFVRKLDRGLRFCVDYQGLNYMTKKDCYSLLLIYKTLRNISKARWFTKLNVITAFYKIRIIKEDE